MPIYLHELVNTVPTRSWDYLTSMAEHHGSERMKRGERDSMLGLWTALEATGTWPLGVNLWQNDTWEGQARALASQFEPKAQNPELKKWWLGNLGLRTGGFDRIIESTSYSLDVAGLRAKGVGGKLFLHQIVHVAPGRVEEYLEAFGADGVPAVERAGAQLVGAYRCCMYNYEAIIILAFRERADFARYLTAWHSPTIHAPDSAAAAQPGIATTSEQATSDAHRASLLRWRERENQWVRQKEALLLRPRFFLNSPWHP